MAKLSIILPSREEPFLTRTIQHLLEQARGDVEVIAVLDGWEQPERLSDPRVTYLWWPEPRGVRPAVNAATRVAQGDYFLKIDAHCAVSEGFDVNLVQSCEPDWIMVPEKYSLDPDTWTRFKEPWQYYYLTYPWDRILGDTPGLHDKNLGPDVNQRFKDRPLDDIVTYQGSAWMLSRQWWNRIGPMDPDRYYIAQEPQELGLRTWVEGGRVVVNKRVWYAHLWKGHQYRRGFPIWKRQWRRAILESSKYGMAQPGMKGVVERFWPVLSTAPLAPWPADWDNPIYREGIS